jgi:hypothetical protein
VHPATVTVPYSVDQCTHEVWNGKISFGQRKMNRHPPASVARIRDCCKSTERTKLRPRTAQSQAISKISPAWRMQSTGDDHWGV